MGHNVPHFMSGLGPQILFRGHEEKTGCFSNWLDIENRAHRRKHRHSIADVYTSGLKTSSMCRRCGWDILNLGVHRQIFAECFAIYRQWFLVAKHWKNIIFFSVHAWCMVHGLISLSFSRGGSQVALVTLFQPMSCIECLLGENGQLY